MDWLMYAEQPAVFIAPDKLAKLEDLTIQSIDVNGGALPHKYGEYPLA
jgi:hypothetical protein